MQFFTINKEHKIIESTDVLIMDDEPYDKLLTQAKEKLGKPINGFSITFFEEEFDNMFKRNFKYPHEFGVIPQRDLEKHQKSK